MGNLIAMPRELKESMTVSSNNLSNSSKRDQLGYLLFTLKTNQRISMTLLRDFVRDGLDPLAESVPMEQSCEHENSADIGQDVAVKTARKNVESKLSRLRYCLYQKRKAQADVTDDLEIYVTEVTRFTTHFMMIFPEET